MTAKLYSKSDCGYAFSDLFFSRTERCIEFEKRKIVNINVLSLVLNYLNQMLNVFVETFNKFSYWSQLWFILSGSFFVMLIIALIVVKIHYKVIYLKQQEISKSLNLNKDKLSI